MSVRFQFESLIFSHSVRSPTVFSTEDVLAIKNGSTIANRKLNPDHDR